MTVLNRAACIGSIKLSKDLKEVKALAKHHLESVPGRISEEGEYLADVSCS